MHKVSFERLQGSSSVQEYHSISRIEEIPVVRNTHDVHFVQKIVIRRHLLEKLDDRIFGRFFFSTVGGGIKKNTIILTKAWKG